MDTKKFLYMFAMVWAMATADGQPALRRKPKIYNALITTDENLVQSRAYPVIQPTIHESGIAHYPVGPYSPYAFYDSRLVRLGQPIAPNLPTKDQLPYQLPPTPYPPQIMGRPLVPHPQAFPGYPAPQIPTESPAKKKEEDVHALPTAPDFEQPAPARPPPTVLMAAPFPEASKNLNPVEKMPTEQVPIPLNQQGLPPSLIRVRQQYPHPYLQAGPSGQPFFLPPYGFQQFPPFIQGPLPALRNPYLPHYGYLPNGPQYPLSNSIPTGKTQPLVPPPPGTENNNQPPPQVPQLPVAEGLQTPPELPKQPTEAPPEPESTFENIKNGSKSEDSNVPDVPPPPIPSGAKAKQS